MAAWLQRFGIVRLCAHGHPEGACSHKRCPGMLDGGKALSVRSIRDATRSFDAALRIASSLRKRKPGNPTDWIEMQNFLGGGSTGRLTDPEDRDDYNIRRQQ
ncbi:MAG: hypothetical protein ABJA93_11160 [Sporichthyaceae bacterium]